MANDHVNKLTGFRVQAQIPLNAKENVASEYILKNLGENNQLAFTYEKGLIVYCQLEGTRYEWRESTLEEENNEEGLLISSFTYPAGLIVNNVDYSNKTYNFFLASSQVNADWNSNSGSSQILNKPNLESSPLQLIYEFGNEGIVIRNRDSLNYGTIGQGAVDLSFNGSASNTHGSTGAYSFTAGKSNVASGYSSTSLGGDNVSTGQHSFTTGSFNRSYGESSFSAGSGNESLYDYSIGLGLNNISTGMGSIGGGVSNFARSNGEVSIGNYGTDYTALGTTFSVITDRVFNIGNGLNTGTRSDAMTILKNGLATLPSVTNSLILNELTGKAIVTKEYLTSVLGASSGGGLQDSIIYNPLIDTEAVIQLSYGASLTIKGEPLVDLISPFLKLDTEITQGSGEYAIAQFGLSDYSGEYFEKGIQIIGNSTTIEVVNNHPGGMVYNNPDITGFYSTSLITKDYADRNFQKIITSNYTVSELDNNYTIFINNGSTPVSITIPVLAYYHSNIEVGFVQQGIGLVTFVASETTLKTPTGLKIKGENYQAYIQQVESSNVWHVLGNVIA